MFEGEILKEVAIDSRLSPAKVRWRQPAISSELSLVTASLNMDGILTYNQVIY